MIENDGRPVGTRTPDLYRVKAIGAPELEMRQRANYSARCAMVEHLLELGDGRRAVVHAQVHLPTVRSSATTANYLRWNYTRQTAALECHVTY